MITMTELEIKEPSSKEASPRTLDIRTKNEWAFDLFLLAYGMKSDIDLFQKESKELLVSVDSLKTPLRNLFDDLIPVIKITRNIGVLAGALGMDKEVQELTQLIENLQAHSKPLLGLLDGKKPLPKAFMETEKILSNPKLMGKLRQARRKGSKSSLYEPLLEDAKK